MGQYLYFYIFLTQENTLRIPATPRAVQVIWDSFTGERRLSPGKHTYYKTHQRMGFQASSTYCVAALSFRPHAHISLVWTQRIERAAHRYDSYYFRNSSFSASPSTASQTSRQCWSRRKGRTARRNIGNPALQQAN